MNAHLSNAEARQLGLPGSDVFRATHICYVNEINRKCGASQLYMEALNAFSQAYPIRHRSSLMQERQANQRYCEKGGLFSNEPMPSTPAIFESLRQANLSHLLIATGFELALKGILLEKGYVLQIIQDHHRYQDLCKRQRNQPIAAGEIIAIDEFRFDGNINYLPGLRDKTIGFSTIVENKAYRDVLTLDDITLDIIDACRALRNEIHFPGEMPDGALKRLQNVDVAEFVIEFVNSHIIPRINAIRQEYDWLGQPLTSWPWL